MEKYFIALRPDGDCEKYQPTEKEKIACAIYSKVKSVQTDEVFQAYESKNSIATFIVMNRTAIASIEMDSKMVEFWEKKILPIYEAEEKFEAQTQAFIHQIMLDSIELDRFINRTKNFEMIQSGDNIEFRYALECLQGKVRPQINKVVKSIFKINKL
jgi:hypothetical protein